MEDWSSCVFFWHYVESQHIKLNFWQCLSSQIYVHWCISLLWPEVAQAIYMWLAVVNVSYIALQQKQWIQPNTSIQSGLMDPKFRGVGLCSRFCSNWAVLHMQGLADSDRKYAHSIDHIPRAWNGQLMKSLALVQNLAKVYITEEHPKLIKNYLFYV